ncbi:hypothetical protein OG599_10715 [Streptomyces sp. NBC_01335]|uniref:hypothetical protein n=1 Tax=Streptomyces sp. NBC_01335 TaxID=2903828 RepID=UPI002E0EAAA0|nr:hypothetical protein OG599_10715 [Streptomyces sp. NBC_01335]
MSQNPPRTLPPACRIRGLAWIPNEYGDILTVLVNTGSRDGYHLLPGGPADDYESSLTSMAYHVRHQTGIEPLPLRLLGTDWMPRLPVELGLEAMGQDFVYLCAPFSSVTDIAPPQAPEGGELEVSGYAWLNPETARKCMSPDHYRRFRWMWSAWRSSSIVVLQGGRPALGEPSGARL